MQKLSFAAGLPGFFVASMFCATLRYYKMFWNMLKCPFEQGRIDHWGRWGNLMALKSRAALLDMHQTCCDLVWGWTKRPCLPTQGFLIVIHVFGLSCQPVPPWETIASPPLYLRVCSSCIISINKYFCFIQHIIFKFKFTGIYSFRRLHYTIEAKSTWKADNDNLEISW